MAFKEGVILGTIDLNASGTANTSIGTPSNSGTITIGNTSSGTVIIDCGTSGISVGNTANAHISTFGSTNTTSATTIQSGSGALAVTSTNGVLTVNSGTGALGISNDATATTVSISTGAGVKSLTVGSTNTTSSTAIQSGSGPLSVTSTNGALSVNSGTGSLGISTDAAATTISLGTGAGVKTITLGSTNTTSTTNLQSGSGGIKIPAFAEGALVTSSTGVISTVTGTTGYVLKANAAGTAPSFQAPTAFGVTWAVTTVDASAVASVGYIANKAGLLTMTLPATASIGDTIAITGINTAVGWRIAQNANQRIHFGTSSSTIGVGGYIEATNIRDTAIIVCVVSGASSEYNVIFSLGNITIV